MDEQMHEKLCRLAKESGIDVSLLEAALTPEGMPADLEQGIASVLGVIEQFGMEPPADSASSAIKPDGDE